MIAYFLFAERNKTKTAFVCLVIITNKVINDHKHIDNIVGVGGLQEPQEGESKS